MHFLARPQRRPVLARGVDFGRVNLVIHLQPNPNPDPNPNPNPNPDPNPNPNPDQIEAKLLNGQKLQGTITAKDVATVLTSKGKEAEFPLFMRIHEIAFEGKPVSSIIDL